GRQNEGQGRRGGARPAQERQESGQERQADPQQDRRPACIAGQRRVRAGGGPAGRPGGDQEERDPTQDPDDGGPEREEPPPDLLDADERQREQASERERQQRIDEELGHLSSTRR